MKNLSLAAVCKEKISPLCVVKKKNPRINSSTKTCLVLKKNLTVSIRKEVKHIFPQNIATQL